MNSHTHSSTLPSRRLSFLESSRQRPRMAQLCLVNEASLIRIRTLINSPAELSGSSRRLTSLILPIQDGRTNGPGSPPRRCIHRQLLPAGDRERKRKTLSWENDGQAVYATDLHSRALPKISEARCSKIYREHMQERKCCIQLCINCIYMY